MTPGQFKRAVEGYSEGQKAQHRLAAWSVVQIINGTGNRKEPLLMSDLLPDELAKPVITETAGESHERIKKRFGV